MMEPPCGTWFFIWFATAAQQSWSELKCSSEELLITLNDVECPVKVHLTSSLPCFCRH